MKFAARPRPQTRRPRARPAEPAIVRRGAEGGGEKVSCPSITKFGGQPVVLKVNGEERQTEAELSEPPPDAAAIDVDEVEKPSRSLSVKIRLRNTTTKRAAAEVIEKAINDWEGLFKSGGL